MGKKNDAAFDAYLLTVYLANECHQRDQESQKAANGGYNGTIKQNTLAEVLAEKATLVQKRLSPIGYLVTIARLFYPKSVVRLQTDSAVMPCRLAYGLAESVAGYAEARRKTRCRQERGSRRRV